MYKKFEELYSKYTGKDILRLLGKKGRKYKIRPVLFASSIGRTPAWVYESIASERRLKHKIAKRIKEAYPDFGK